MEDHILRITASQGEIRGFFAYTTHTVNQAQKIHGLSPVAAAALGRLLTGGAIMGSMLKENEDLLTIRVKGDGPLQGMTVTVNNQVHVKGFVNEPVVDLPLNAKKKLDVGKAVGKGTLTVVKDLGMKEPVSGHIALQTGEIAEDLAYYFVQSEQTPTAVNLGVLIDRDYSCKQAGGLILQLLPGAEEKLIEKIETRLNEMESITTLLDQGLTPKDIMNRLFEGMDIQFYEEQKVAYQCACSRAKVEDALISLGKEELTDIIQTDQKAEINCHFCNITYIFTKKELEDLIEKLQ